MTASAIVQPFVSDLRGRELRDLRISVTDRCNLRCSYCMPRSHFGPGHEFLPAAQLLMPAQIETLAKAFLRCGVRRIRLTGGEPLLRAELCDIVRRLAGLDIEDLALTTNGVLLGRLAYRLKRSGLSRLTVSLDTLDAATFSRISDVRVPLATVLDGLAAAEAAGFSPIKINCVVRRGHNDSDLEALIDFARRRRHTLRFIEYMDVGVSNGWQLAEVVTGAEIVERVGARHALQPVAEARRGEVARRYRFLDGGGEIGIISSISQPFCGDCTRARLSADGRLFTCLFAAHGRDLGELVRAGCDAAGIAAVIQETWSGREDRYSELRSERRVAAERVEMSYIGG